MDLKLLRALVGVAEHGTVSKAAEVLHITQPALSRQIRNLEAQAGFKLFERAGRGLRLTPRGEQFAADSRNFLTSANAFGERAQELRRGDIKVLRVAAAALTIEAMFPAFLKRYVQCVRDVRMVLIDAHAADHLSLLERREADVSVNVLNMLPLDSRRFAIRPLQSFHMLAAGVPALMSDLGSASDITRLAGRPLLLLDRSYATRNVFDAACHLADFKPNVFLESRSVNTLLAMADAGHGVAVVPSALHSSYDKLRTCVVTHRGEPLPLNIAVVWDRQNAPLRHVEAFADLFEEHVRETYRPAASNGSRPRGSKPRGRAGTAKATSKTISKARPTGRSAVRRAWQRPGLAG
ncbi:MAG: LysR family transcriptional regulator [Alphaproteobacteria bacterium]|nr:LysR family transcriptional regulator [Alphaproteobacteria bacterium]